MAWVRMGYNHQLRDFDLRLAANAASAFLIISKENLNERHQQRNAGDLPLEHWKYSNQLNSANRFVHNYAHNCAI